MQQKITINDAIDLFLLDAEARRLSKETRRSYQVRLNKFSAWCGEHEVTDLGSITSQYIRRFQISLQVYSAKYQHNTSGALRTFFRFCMAERLLTESPFANVKMPKLPNRILPAFTTDELNTLIQCCGSERDHAIVLFLLDSGLRASELIALRLKHYDAKSGTVIVIAGKGAKDRTTHIGAKTRKQLKRYFLNERGDMGAEDYIFVSAKGGTPLTLWGLMQIMARLRKRSGIAHCTAHTFRRTFAIQCLRNGMNIHVLAKLMGHSDIAILKQYLDITEADLRNAHGEHGPVDNF